MKTTQYQSFVLLSLLSLASAWPVIRSPINLAKRIPQSYSVVAVDGGSTTTASASASPTTLTVTSAITQTSTVVSTISAATATAVPQTVTYETTIVVSTQATVTVSPSSTPYDDGQWHTTYYFRGSPTGAANANGVVATSPVAPSPTTSIDPGQWAAWSGQNNGQYHGQ